MVNKLIKRAFDSNAWTYTGNSYGQAVAPEVFDEEIRDYQTKKLVISPLGEQFDFTRPGRDLTVTVDAAPSAAAETSETDAANVVSITNRQITFSPSEYTVKFEASYQEMEDGFLPFMGNATKKIGYSLAQAKDKECRTALYNNAGHSIFVNGKTAASDIDSSDDFTTTSLVDARKKIGQSYYEPKSIVISRTQEAALLKTGNIYKADEFGTRQAIENGLIGNLYGFDIYVSDSLVTEDNVEYAIALGQTQTGEKAFGVANARMPKVEMDRDITYRQMLLVGSERFDAQVIHPDAVALVGSYAE